MGILLEQMRECWENVRHSDLGRREISKYDQVIDFVVTERGMLVERFQICAKEGNLHYRDEKSLIKQQEEQMFVVALEKKDFNKLFDKWSTFIDLWCANLVRCLPTMKKDYLIGWTARIFEITKKV